MVGRGVTAIGDTGVWGFGGLEVVEVGQVEYQDVAGAAVSPGPQGRGW